MSAEESEEQEEGVRNVPKRVWLCSSRGGWHVGCG
jgi:hypothetical protein